MRSNDCVAWCSVSKTCARNQSSSSIYKPTRALILSLEYGFPPRAADPLKVVMAESGAAAMAGDHR